MPLPLTKDRIEKLLIDAGHAINANDGRCAVIEDVLCRFTTLCTDLLQDRPLWMGDAANRILDSWEEWEQEAGMVATCEQNDDAEKYAMLGKIEAALAEEWRK